MRDIITTLLLLLGIGAFAQSELNIYISSRNTNSIKRYQSNGVYLGDFVAPGAGGLGKPQDLFFHPYDGTLLVTGIDNTAILEYDPHTGEFLGNFSSGYTLSRPTKMRIGPDSLIYVSQWDPSQNKVVRFDLNGIFVDEFTGTGVPNGCGVDWDSEGNLYVTSYNNGTNGSVYRFDPEGDFLGIFLNSTQLNGPVGIWKNTDGDWFVTDWSKGTVEQYGAQGNYSGIFISGLANVEGHAFDALGNIYLCDWTDNRVYRYQSDGILDTLLINTGGLRAPNSIIFGPAPEEVTSVGSAQNTKPGMDVQVYPNPASDTFMISSPSLTGRAVAIMLIDADGQMVYQAENKLFTDQWRISWRDFPKGSYFCKVWVEGQLVITRKLIKQ